VIKAFTKLRTAIRVIPSNMPITQVRKSEKIKQKENSSLLNQERETKSLLAECRKTTTEQTFVKGRQWREGS